ncbi:NAD(P)/FAD-dependent oxidoreductase [Conexibacter sp. SYSU D00693]|uniref:phytoene desaturase family protein n=1 Tax=Conexibacter sp. SYSU D00693 TaxID=2812560 RepID=UPI00196B0FEC|nr:NAD(P)/FAD-dependent oxidoreductase [Conexibacter sp. SYSU D00693]
MSPAAPRAGRYDAVVLGGGHNGLAAAAYLSRAGRSVLLLERDDELGGATRSIAPFPGVDVRLSRYAYLVSLLPRQVVDELGLDVRLAPRAVSSCTPDPAGGPPLVLGPDRGPDREHDGFARWDALVAGLQRLAPTLLHPLPSREDARRIVGEAAWEALVERPLGEALEAHFGDDLVRGLVLTDGLIGTAAGAHDPSRLQNRCFLLHVVAGPWDVPVGGMGAVSAALAGAALGGGAELRRGCEVTAVGEGGEVRFTEAGGAEHVVQARHVLAALAPAVLDRLRGRPAVEPAPRGSQLKVNLVVDRLPALRDGTPPEVAFAGTFHAGEGYARLQAAHEQWTAGVLPDPLPCELYCHTLTDPSILGPAERARGRHTLTLFGLHCPVDADRDAAVAAALRAVDAHLAQPLMDVVARDAGGRPCLEASTPRDLERAVALPGGHIFHRDLDWPWACDEAEVGSWGVETDDPRILLAGAGARRGGGVSAIPGRSAAIAVLENG